MTSTDDGKRCIVEYIQPTRFADGVDISSLQCESVTNRQRVSGSDHHDMRVDESAREKAYPSAHCRQSDPVVHMLQLAMHWLTTGTGLLQPPAAASWHVV